MESHARVPLRDQTNDLVLAKRAKLLSATQSKYQQQQQNQQDQQNQQQANTTAAVARKRPVLEGAEFKEWQSIWRKTMKESVIYFYGDDGNNMALKLESEKAKFALRQLGARITPFFDSDVTIIISRKPYDKRLDYRPGDVFHSAALNGLKVWTLEKVFRFLKNLGEPTPQIKVKQHQSQDLSVLLTQERLHGPIDRDFTAKRDDFHYFKGLYFYCYDLRQVYRPVAIREWTCKQGQDEDSAGFPQLYPSTNGRCPFQDDPTTEASPRKALQRQKLLEQNAEFRRKLIKASRIKRKRTADEMNEESDSEVDDSFYKSSSSSSCSSPQNDRQTLSSNIEKKDDNEAHEEEEDDERDVAEEVNIETFTKKNNINYYSLMAAPNSTAAKLHKLQRAQISRQSSMSQSTDIYQSNFPVSNQGAKYFEIQASGMNNQSTAVSQTQLQQDFGNNGLAPSRAEVLTKSFKNLDKKVTRANKSASLKEVIDSKKKREEAKLLETTNKATVTQAEERVQIAQAAVLSTAGYCESCRLKYDDFDQHIVSAKHRSFALKDSNFEQIDDLIRKIHDTNILHS